MSEKIQLKRSLFGLHRRKVDAYLRQLKVLQDEEWNQLRLQVENQLREREQLEIELERVKALCQPKIAETNSFGQAVKKAEELLSLLESQGKLEEEASSLLQELAKAMSGLLPADQTFVETTESKQEDPVGQGQKREQEIEQKPEPEQVPELELKPEPVQMSVQMPNSEPEQEQEAAQAIVIPFKLRTSLETYPAQITADGLDVPDTLATAYVTSNELASTASPTLDVSESSPVESSRFWGDINSYLSDHAIGRQGTDVRETEIVPVAKPVPASEAQPPAEMRNTAGKEQGMESEALSEEISAIRNRYIVGKLAGEDLLDQHGELIIAKHEVITAEVLARADKAGKLADLIVNMKIARAGQDGTP